MALVTYGERVKDLRKQQGLSQEEFAKLAGINRSYITGIESGKRNVSLENIEKIACALGVSLSDFFAYDKAIPQEIIYLNINGEQFALKASKPLTRDQKDYLEILSRTCYDDAASGEEYTEILEMSDVDLAGWFVEQAKKELGVELRFVPIADEYKI